MEKEAAILMFLGVLCLRICFVASLNRSVIDESSLLALKKTINSDIFAKNWSQETSFCTWIGVTCSHKYPRVTGLNLSNMGLQGTIARDIGNLSFLTFLDMSNNSIHGLIPSEIGNLRRLEGLYLSDNYLNGDISTGFGNLSRLQELHLRQNQLIGELPATIFNISSLLTILVGDNQMSGSIPKQICRQSAKLEDLELFSNLFEGEILSNLIHCHSLKKLSLSDNNFTGNIPDEFWNLSAIQRVYLHRNGFTGMFPASIGNLSNLEELDFGENSFHGRVPSEMGQLSSLTFLNLGGNKLNGELPQSVFNISSLRILALGLNNLSGNIPISIDKGLPNIQELYLIDNHFLGKIPNSISNLTQLRVLQIARNSFSGDIPITLGNLHRLEQLHLARNQLTNNLSNPEQDFLSSLTTCKNLKFIILYANPITGVLPKSLGSSNLSASLLRFRASSCRIISSIPSEIGNLSNLLWLDLGYNGLTGAIPMELGNVRNLQRFDINRNKLQGSISYGLCNLNNLYSVNLANNDFSGQLPGCLGNLSSLREINFANNALNSNIPSTLWFNERIEKLNFSNNFFDGLLPLKIGSMESLMELDLSDNRISGEIPSTIISQLQKLISLTLSNNKLNGSIPESLAVLKNLQSLDLSNNYLSGPIPKSLEELAYLSYFNVSFNDLSGEIPDKGPFVEFTAELFTGNKGLCGAPRFKVKTCRRTRHAPSRKTKPLKYILPAIASIVVAAIMLAVIFRHRDGKLLPSSLSNRPLGLVHERVSYYEILRATSHFDEENLIGRGSFGSVFKGNFSDATVAAIKVFNSDVQGPQNSFDTECQVMRSIRHRNLVKIITSCSNLDFKALVMVYMPNGNLAECLYSTNCSLNIFQRLDIMIDVASALEYLHEGNTFPIVHCDLKPSNILLDEDMVAHVGDFGISKLLSREQRMQQTTTLGTIGYMAPEYGSEGLVSTLVDVYSYGILLMEVFSRRKPTDEMFSGELTMKRWVSESFPNTVMEIVDGVLVNRDDENSRGRHENCLISVIEVALECTADLSEDRPRMEEVLVKLGKIKLNLSNHD